MDADLREKFGELKSDPNVVYPMEAQLQLLMDLFAVGEHRPFGVEALAGDAVFAFRAGGVCPSLDTLYRDLARFDEPALAELDAMVGVHGVAPLRARHCPVVHLDVDTTVTPVFGEHEGALPGPNPRYHGRPSYHPILARVAETDSIVGAAFDRATAPSARRTSRPSSVGSTGRGRPSARRRSSTRASTPPRTAQQS